MENSTRRSWIRWVAALPIVLVSFLLFKRRKTIASPVTQPPSIGIEEIMRKRALDNFPYEIVVARGDLAYSEWHRLKNLGVHWPVVIGSDEDLDRILEPFDPAFVDLPKGATDTHPRTIEQIIAAAALIAFPSDLKNWPGAYPIEELTAPLGNWPVIERVLSEGISVATNVLTNQFHEKVNIVLIPTQNSWEVPAYLRWGDWNACPPPEYHVAALKKWKTRYGADLVGMSGDVLDIRVQKKPATRDEAIRLAREQYYYCPDIVDQGANSISNLAAALKNSDWWSFWWD